MEIPWEKLSNEALASLIEEFVTREGTEYGAAEIPLDRKVEQVRGQLRGGVAYISFDPRTETASIQLREDD
ncbi:MAG TPA: YheU family protein [Pseudomonadales bacterium]|nr:YheU family protein [Pseudomonadales bacterium]